MKSPRAKFDLKRTCLFDLKGDSPEWLKFEQNTVRENWIFVCKLLG